MNHKKNVRSFRAPLKWLGIFLLLLAYLLCSGILTVLPSTSTARRRFRTRTTSLFSTMALGLFGVRIHIRRGDRLLRAGKGSLVVANHISYVDILVLSALLPSVFITSVELRNTPLLGLLARFGGSLFVERRSRASLKREIEDISRILEQGFAVVLFPEGTTSNGDGVRPFKKSLFDSALSARADILPLCLKYTRINNRPISAGSKDDLFYYGGVAFTDHFPRFLSLKSVDVEVIPLKTVKIADDACRKELAAAAYDLIAGVYHA